MSNRNDQTVTRIDPLNGEPVTHSVGNAPNFTSAAGGEFAVALATGGSDPAASLDGKIATLFSQDDPLYTTDPVVFDPNNSGKAGIHDAIDLKLARPSDDDGDGVQEIVPDGANAPVVTDGGRTWTFRLKKGFRFSPPSGAPVTAAVFKASLERAASPDFFRGGASPDFLDDVVGEKEYRARKAEHISGITVRGDTLVIRLVRPATDLAARLALQMYAAVPLGTPIEEEGLRTPIPSAGPYMLTRYSAGRDAVLRRNPNYPGPRSAAFDAFVIRFLVGNEAGVARIQAGEGDMIMPVRDFGQNVTIPAALGRGGELQRRYGSGDKPQYIRLGHPFTSFIRFNTLRGPFTDVRLRHAVNLALDRRELAEPWDGEPADHFIPPGPAAHQRQGTVYPLDGSGIGQARRLLEKADPGRTITLGVDARASNLALAEIVKRQLARVGLDVRTTIVGQTRTEAKNFDMTIDTWLLDFIDPGNTLPLVLDPDGTHYDQYTLARPPVFTDPFWIKRIRALEKLSGANRDRGYANLDHELAKGPTPLAVLSHGATGHFVSESVGCVRNSGNLLGQIDLAALCPR